MITNVFKARSNASLTDAVFRITPSVCSPGSTIRIIGGAEDGAGTGDFTVEFRGSAEDGSNVQPTVQNITFSGAGYTTIPLLPVMDIVISNPVGPSTKSLWIITEGAPKIQHIS